MLDISHAPLSNHEIFQAKALARKYKEAQRDLYSIYFFNKNIPKWIIHNARNKLSNVLEKFERDIDIGNAFYVRLELQFPLELPENGEDV